MNPQAIIKGIVLLALKLWGVVKSAESCQGTADQTDINQLHVNRFLVPDDKLGTSVSGALYRTA